MTWDQIAEQHKGHRLILLDARTVECHDCEKRKLILPREQKQVGHTTPPRYVHTVPDDLPSPELIAYRKREAEEALRLIVQRRREQATGAPEGQP